MLQGMARSVTKKLTGAYEAAGDFPAAFLYAPGMAQFYSVKALNKLPNKTIPRG